MFSIIRERILIATYISQDKKKQDLNIFEKQSLNIVKKIDQN